MQEQHERFFETLDWDGCNIKDMPHVQKQHSGKERDVDEMLDELGRRVWKNGRLDEYRDRQHFTSDSKQKRAEREAQAHRAEEGKSRDSWRGGVEA